MALVNVVPELWSTRLNQKLNEALVFGGLCNRDYEGDIQAAGDTVRINQVGNVSIAAYTKNSTSITPEELQDYQTTLSIDTAKYFAFQVDDVDKAQANVNAMDAAMQTAAWGLKNAADESIAALYTDAGDTVTTTAIDSTNVLAALLTCGQKLSENNIPSEGRWAVVPPWVTVKLTLAKALVADQGAMGAWQNGFVGRCAGFNVYESNNVSNDATTYQIMTGTSKAISFAAQVNKVEFYRSTTAFADVARGLYLYGVKVIYPDALVVLPATVGSEP